MIPKYPRMDQSLTDVQINQMTDIVFGEISHSTDLSTYDYIFVFGGTQPGNWQTALDAYQKGLSRKIIVTGGFKSNGIQHSEWNQGSRSESSVIKQHLVEHGVPEDAILIEEKSTNSLENIHYAKELISFDEIQSVLFISKSFATGRQLRTLQKNLPSHIWFVPYSFDTQSKSNQLVTRTNWKDYEETRSFIYGEYLRIVHYGEKGDIEPLESPIEGVPLYVEA